MISIQFKDNKVLILETIPTNVSFIKDTRIIAVADVKNDVPEYISNLLTDDQYSAMQYFLDDLRG